MMLNIINNKKARANKLTILFILISLTLIIPLSIDAVDNGTNVEEQVETPLNLCEEVTCDDSTLECPDGTTISCENDCDSESGLCSSCTPECLEIIENESIEIENSTIPKTILEENTTLKSNLTNLTSSEPVKDLEESNSVLGNPPSILEAPQLDIQIISEERITRGNILTLKAIVINVGESSAKDILLSWKLEDGFEIISDNSNERFEEILPGESVISEIQIQTSISTPLGNNKLKLGVTY